MASKLKNEQGATIMMALLFLLVAMMVSCVVLAAAATAGKTVASDRNQQQAYLNVSSAAKLLRKEMVATTVRVGTVTYTRDGSSWSEQERSAASISLQSVWTQALKAIDKGQPYEATFTIQVTGLDAVTVQFYVRTDFTVIATLTGGDPDQPCRLVMTAKPSRGEDKGDKGETDGVRIYHDVTVYTWSASNCQLAKEALS